MSSKKKNKEQCEECQRPLAGVPINRRFGRSAPRGHGEYVERLCPCGTINLRLQANTRVA